MIVTTYTDDEGKDLVALGFTFAELDFLTEQLVAGSADDRHVRFDLTKDELAPFDLLLFTRSGEMAVLARALEGAKQVRIINLLPRDAPGP